MSARRSSSSTCRSRSARTCGAAGQSDSLVDTIDYDHLKRIVLETFAKESRYLIESLAEEIAERILRETPALEATISIQKPEVWDNGVPGVNITRKA